jgi:hypothetical protein
MKTGIYSGTAAHHGAKVVGVYRTADAIYEDETGAFFTGEDAVRTMRALERFEAEHPEQCADNSSDHDDDLGWDSDEELCGG